LLSELRSVQEIDEIGMIHQRKKIFDAQRKKDRQEFEQRQKELEERRNSKNRQVAKKKIMISDQVMGSPIQKMGKVSNFCRREEAILSDGVIDNREQFLRKPLTLKEPEKSVLSAGAFSPLPSVSSKLVKKILGRAASPDFNPMELIQTKDDETVFGRINPHLPEVKARVNLPDQSLAALLKKNGGVPLCRKQKEPTRVAGQKAFHEMTEFEQKTFNFIYKLRREMTSESLQATLVQYIKTNRDEEKLNEFCRELLVSLKQQKEANQRKMGSLRTSRMSVADESPQAKTKMGFAALDYETRKEMFLGNKVGQELKDYMVEEYITNKEQEKQDKIKKEEENKQFEKMTKQQKGTRFALTKQERERIVSKLGDIFILEAK
jgi:hypothetical protein